MPTLTRPASLTARLVLTTVALVVAVAVLIGVAASAALHAQLTNQIDDQLTQAVQGPRPDGLSDSDDPDGDGDNGFDRRNRGPQTLLARISDTAPSGVVLGTARGTATQLDDKALDQLADVPVDGQVHDLDLEDFGDYRVIATPSTFEPGAVDVTGLPTKSVQDAVTSLVGWEALLIALGALLATGGGLLLVRRQLRPLTEVAATAHAVSALPLDQGGTDLTERVPERLTDERTEVGQVGAALNTLLAHVATSLEARDRSEQQVRQFVADASHELRTPLANIAGYTELARRRPDPQTTATALVKVEEESGRMTALVEDLLLLARLDAGRPLEREPVDLTRLLVEAVDDARVVGPDHTWRLKLPKEPLEVVGDDQRLHQVVTNLLTNARTHTPAGTTITVIGHPDGFEVHDDGPGFPPGFVGTAFERFARADQARTRTGGAGLGLALVEAIVRSHGGAVSLASAPGSTSIRVRLDGPGTVQA